MGDDYSTKRVRLKRRFGHRKLFRREKSLSSKNRAVLEDYHYINDGFVLTTIAGASLVVEGGSSGIDGYPTTFRPRDPVLQYGTGLDSNKGR